MAAKRTSLVTKSSTPRRRTSAINRIRLRILCDSVIAIGPGKADLLLAIDATGSISSAARSMGMSYRRAWLLVETMNEAFRSPLVSTARGGAEGGGAILTATGLQVLSAYQELVEQARQTFAPLLQRES